MKDTKEQIAKDYERKALIILKKGQSGELDQAEADRLAGEALKKKQTAMNEVQMLTTNLKNYEASLTKMENKVLELKSHIKKAEEEYTSLKARATVAKTTRKINEQLAGVNSDSTMAMIEEISKDDITIIFLRKAASVPAKTIAAILKSTSCLFKNSIEKPSFVVSNTSTSFAYALMALHTSIP